MTHIRDAWYCCVQLICTHEEIKIIQYSKLYFKFILGVAHISFS